MNDLIAPSQLRLLGRHTIALALCLQNSTRRAKRPEGTRRPKLMNGAVSTALMTNFLGDVRARE